MGEETPVRPAPIAIVGMACRVPGADGPDAFWQLLMDEVCSVEDVPPTRFGRPYEIPGARVRSGLLEDVDRFDAEHFGISPREAAGMDPQQRLFMETVWEALEDAGQDPARLAGTRTGVYVGTTNVHYWDLQQSVDFPDIHASLGAGSRSTTTGRVSFALGITGPGLSVDTACSSSLTAIALACQSLRAGESTLAIAGGSQLLLANTENHGFVDAGVFGTDCRFGDASADGFVFSEGVGVVLLKPLDRAVADGDPIRAVIRGWGMNNDGAGSDTMINPALSGQRQMLQLAYEHAGIPVSDVDYIETHGTGTRAGDPVELGAIAAVLGGRDKDRPPLLVGSVKSNIGHTGSAAGVLGLIKTVLALQHRTAPRSLHVTERTPAIDWDATGLDIPHRSAVPLEAEGRPLTAGVSGFGVSGTNVHLVVTEADAETSSHRTGNRPPASPESGTTHILPLSAASPQALRQRLQDMVHHLSPGGAGRGAAIADICHTAATRRAHYDCRVTVVGDSHDALAERLRDVLAEDGVRPYAGRPQVAFVFSGHGSQWIGMARELMDTSTAFSAALIRCDDVVRNETGWSVIDRLTDGSDLVGETVAVVHPVLWAVQVSLAETWRAWGVEPDVVIGHSMGESAAACVAGALSLADAAAVVCRRARLIRDRVAGRGTMSVAALPAADAEALIAELAVNVSVAASNGPRTTVLAGEIEGIEKIKAELDARDVFCRVMKAEAASHCAQMDPLLDELGAELREIAPRAGRIPMRSTVTGELEDGSGLDASYWTRNIRGRVHFHEAVLSTALAAETVFIEISPHPILSSAVQDSLQDAALPGTAVGSLIRDEPDRQTLLTQLGRVYESGARVDWDGLYGGGRLVPLPTYPWQRESYWVEDLEALPQSHTFPLAASDSPFLADAPAHGPALLHGPAFAEAARVAAARTARTDAVLLTDVTVEDALAVHPGSAPALRVTLTPGETDGSWGFSVTGGRDGRENEHARGTATVAPGLAAAVHEPLARTLERCPQRLDGAAFYARMAGTKELFQVVDELWLGQGEAVGRLRRPAGLAPHPDHPVHPALLAAAAQPALALLPDMAYLTEHVGRVTVLGPQTDVMWSKCWISEVTPDGLLFLDMALLDEAENVVVEATRMRMRRQGGGTEAGTGAEASAEDEIMSTEPEPVHERGAVTGQSVDGGIELTGELRLTDPSSGFVVELRGSLRISQAGAASPSPAGTAPARTTAPVAQPTTAPAPVVAVSPAAVARPTADRPAEDAPAADRPVVDRVAAHVAAVLKMRVARLDVNKRFNQLGMDSLMATELRKRLEKELGVDLPLTRLVRETTTASLARELEAEITG
ncbi:type I polyketide synthase [Streptomyces sp. TLI_146]|uniref:type I polyketide synthase n=1 Tax=Streptomyces sp. TLI_146 TaxID=1938858 RepID=UPI000C701C10|nr:type I polyketide synthase [Streptomyces sp. TLI_146]PKV83528.1 acyl transferase domain-containing protein [Streptomyces sp. TLI_146]